MDFITQFGETKGRGIYKITRVRKSTDSRFQIIITF